MTQNINVSFTEEGAANVTKQITTLTDSEKAAEAQAKKTNDELKERQKLLVDAGEGINKYVAQLQAAQKAAVGAFGVKQLKDFEAQATKAFKAMAAGAAKGSIQVDDFNDTIKAMVTGGLTEAGVSIVEFNTALKAAGVTMDDFVATISGNVMGEFAEQFEQTETASRSLKSQLKTLKDQLAVMESEGKEGGKAFQEMAIQAAKLEDQIGDTAERVRVMSSDTANLDAGVEAINLVATGFQLAAGTAALFGANEEDLQKVLVKLNGIMAVTNSLKEIQTFLTGQSILKIKLEAAAHEIYAVAVGTSTGAMKAFRIAMLASGIGVLIAAIVIAIKAYDDLKEKTEKAAWATKQAAEINKQAAESAGQETGALKILKAQVESTNVPMETRLQLVKDIKKQYPEYFKGLSTEKILAGDVGKAYDLAAAAILKKAKANAAAAEIEKIVADNLKIEMDLEQKATAANDRLTKARTEKTALGAQGYYKVTAETRKRKIAGIKEDFEDDKNAARDTLRVNGEKIAFLTKFAVAGAEQTVKIEEEKHEKIKKVDDSGKKAFEEKEKDLATFRLQQDADVRQRQHEQQIKQDDIAFSTKKEATLDIGQMQINTNQVLNETIAEQNKAQDERNAEETLKRQEEAHKKQLEKTKAFISAMSDFIGNAFGDTAGGKIALQAINLGTDLLNINEQIRNKEITEQEGHEAKMLAIKKAGIAAAQEVSNAIFEAAAEKRQAELEQQLQNLQTARDQELNSKNLTEQQKDDINKKYAAKERTAKLKAFEEDKKAKRNQAIINGLLGITQAFATSPWPISIVFAALVAATAALSVAKISSTQPGFKKGGFTGNKRRDEIAGFVHGQEFVAHAEATAKYKPALEAINQLKFDEYLTKIAPTRKTMSPLPEWATPSNSSAGIDYDKLGRSVAAHAKAPSMIMNFDEDGATAFLIEKNRQVLIRNKRYKL